jgi:transposase
LEPSAYIHHLLTHIAQADTVEKLEALLPWIAELPASKKVAQYP